MVTERKLSYSDTSLIVFTWSSASVGFCPRDLITVASSWKKFKNLFYRRNKL